MSIPRFAAIYNSLTAEEEKEFRKFASVNYFSRKRDYTNILKTLKLMKRRDELLNDSEFVISRLMELAQMNTRALQNRLSELTGISEYFFVFRRLSRDEMLRKSLVTEELTSTKKNELMRFHISPFLKSITNRKESRGRDYLIHTTASQISKYYFELGDTEKFKALYQIQSQHFMAHFLIQLFKQGISMLLQAKDNIHYKRNTVNDFLEIFDAAPVLESIRKASPRLFSEVSIHYLIYMSFLKPAERRYYEETKRLLVENRKLFGNSLKLEIYVSLKDYCIDKTNSGAEEFYNEIFELNNRILDERLFSELNVLESNTNNFRNFIFAAIRLNKPGWVKQFIANHAADLPAEIREDETNISNGILLIHEKNFSAALECFNQVKRKNYLHYLDTSVYKEIIFYETDDIEECYREIARLKNYLRQHKEIPVYLKNSYQRFVRMLERLLKLKQKPERGEIMVFIKEMEPLKNIGMGNWLWQKAGEL